ncbi:type II toxin-antitoxin system VapC family toxin [Sphingobium boeckii]|uniref:PIN domain-containing protein n=1 Tax=Sphingobium boeckii TaxID=1082345 RepID=A0A7W9EF06_9SPHN|nr:type II toxin-antitoxin system VapC family toxin [Sphingobium boeckii]MBB5685580.1 hypothetical protein [Sphingobium boeckii]
MSLYFDTSVLVPIHLIEPTTNLLTSWIALQSGPFIVSDLAAGEFNATVSRLVRMTMLTEQDAQTTIEKFEIWRDSFTHKAANEPADIRIAAQFVRVPKPKLLMPDAIHLATCQRLGHRLVTFDRELVDMAEARGIETVIPA